ncbi:MAG TPA: hypothetical protein ENN51_00395 [candidate division WOR-3 bacterium]|uniref:Sulfatase-modifying factor enzyme-like domain-containing protein n=1 Tax=candidate division WOR-3 bacterium TaxID=2052148 RepID=A0A7V0T4E9_UNCW3|nr:hypothetical protein [candidate division WOR-3 bacterium]
MRPGSNRVIRGGSWNNNARNARCANRNRNEPSNRNNNNGFRCSAQQWPRGRRTDAAGLRTGGPRRAATESPASRVCRPRRTKMTQSGCG